MITTNPGHIIEALMDCGWQVAGQKSGVYVRLARPYQHNRSLVVPLDQTAPEYQELLNAAVAQLEDAVRVGSDAGRALDRWRGPSTNSKTSALPADGHHFDVSCDDRPDCEIPQHHAMEDIQ